MIKAIIYDLDDLMVNSHPLHYEAWEVLLKKYKHSNKDLPKEYHSKFIGARVIDIAKVIKKTLKLNIDLKLLYKERMEIFIKLVKQKLEPMPGLLYSLKLLRANNFKIAVASSGTKEYINLVLTKFEIRDYFDVIISGDDVKKGKPDPETFIVACKKLNLKAEECLVLEDAERGIEAAKRAGCKCIGVENPHTPSQDRSGADKIIPSLNVLTLGMIDTL